MEATAKDLRFKSKELLDSVSRGEEVVITYRGKPCARLVPYEQTDHHEGMNEKEFFGIWKDPDEIGDVDQYVRKIRKERY